MRILFVDDDPDTRTLARRAVLQEFPGAEVAEASDGSTLEEALGGKPLEILVSDYDLQWIDGFEILDRTRRAHPECVAIMFTGTGNEELAVRALKSGFDDYVVKAPGQLKRLAQSVRSAVDRRDERRLLRDNRDLLRQELYHRLHNNLQVVISLLRLTLKAIEDPGAKSQVQDLMHRIRTLGLLQEQVYRAEDLRNVDIGTFILSIAHELTGRAFEETVESINVPVDLAVPVGLIANEMIMQAITFAENGPEAVKVTLGRSGLDVELAVGPAGAAVQSADPGLGIDLIRRLAAQIDGRVTQDPRAGIARLTFSA